MGTFKSWSVLEEDERNGEGKVWGVSCASNTAYQDKDACSASWREVWLESLDLHYIGHFKVLVSLL